MVRSLTAGTVESRLFHDSRRPLHVENFEAGIKQKPTERKTGQSQAEQKGDGPIQ